MTQKISEMKFDYDKENDDLYIIRKDSNVKSSVMFGDMILDVSKDDMLVGIEMLDASNILGVSCENLESIIRAEMHVFYKPNMVLVRIRIFLKNTEREISIPIATETLLEAAIA